MDMQDTHTHSLEGDVLEVEDFRPETGERPEAGAARAASGLPPGLTAQAESKPKRNKRRLLALGALIAALGAGGYYGNYWWTEGRFLVSTDDAYVKADLSVLSAKVSGNITDVPVKENTSVKKGDVLAQIDERDYKIAVDAARTSSARRKRPSRG